jgi:transposase InsO family protein
MSIDTFSGCLLVAGLAGETTKNVISHCLHYFSVLGILKQIKTDNGIGYYSQAFEMFCQQFNITHITGIPCSSQGQGIVEL